MTYSFKNFSVGEVLTATTMDQISANIRDHVHGVDSVVHSGLHFGYENKTGAYTVVAGDIGKVISCSGTFTVTLPAAADVANGWAVTIHNRGTGTITVDGNGAETIDGVASKTLGPGASLTVFEDSNAAEWRSYGGGGWSFIESDTPAAASQVDFTNAINSFDRIRLSGFVEMSSTGSLQVQLMTSATVRTSGYLTRWIEMGTSGPLQTVNTSQSTAQVSRASAGAGRTLPFQFVLDNLKATGGSTTADVTTILGYSAAQASSGFDLLMVHGYCQETNVINNAVDGIRVLTSVGNFTTGSIIVEGQNK